MIFASEWWLADQQLMNENAKCPIIDGAIMSFIQNNFRSHIFWEASIRYVIYYYNSSQYS